MFSSFENLPNELIYEIFQFIDGLDLYRIFFNLNSRLNTILHSISKIYVRLDSMSDTKYLYMDSQSMQIQSSYFTRLTYLQIDYIEECNETFAFLRMIFSNGFPSLKTCIFDTIFPPDQKYPWSYSNSLRSLVVNAFSITAYYSILSACPNLVHLHWSIIRYTESANPTIAVRHDQLRYLYFRTINLENIESILRCVQHLKRLHIVSDWSRGNNCAPLDFKQLGEIFNRCVPYLQYFECDTMERNPINIEKIRNFHPCFKYIQYEIVPDGRTRFFTVL